MHTLKSEAQIFGENIGELFIKTWNDIFVICANEAQDDNTVLRFIPLSERFARIHYECYGIDSTYLTDEELNELKNISGTSAREKIQEHIQAILEYKRKINKN